MSLKNYTFLVLLFGLSHGLYAQQTKILFDATKAEAAGNADWVIDADLHDLSYSTGPAVVGVGGNESNPQQIPFPGQASVTSTTLQSYWQGGISAWGIDLVKKGYWVESLPYNGQITYGNSSNPQDLSNYKVFIVCEPNILFTASEKTALMQFVQNGGGLFMVSDHNISDRNNDGYDSPHIWNDFMTNNGVLSNPFGMSFDYDDFSQITANIPNLPADPLLHGVMGNVTQAKWSNGTSITLSPVNNSSILGVVYKLNSAFGNTGAMVAYATYGSGKVVGLGDSSPCDDGSGDSGDQLYDGWIADAGGNHRTLIMNATIWLASSSIIAPVVTTMAATSITTTTASSGGNISDAGGSPVTTRGVCWSTSVNPVATGNHTSDGSGIGTYSSSITGLTANTIYHVRAYATNSGGTGYGSDIQLTTTAFPTLSVAPLIRNVLQAAGTTTFTVTSNSSWTVSSDQLWCTVTASGTGNGTITANYIMNSSVSTRIANITITVTGLPTVIVTLNQEAALTATLMVNLSSQAVILTGFNYILNTGPSVSQNYTLSGTSLTPAAGNITITGTANFEVSVNNSTFGNSAVVAYVSSTLSNTVIYVRLKSGLVTGNYFDESVVNSGGGAVSVGVACSGNVTSSFLPEPTNYPASFSALNILVQWTNASGSIVPDGYLVRMSSIGFADIQIPNDGITYTNSYTDQNVTDGSHNAWFTNLNPNTAYYFKLFGYTGSGTDINYKIDGSVPQVLQVTGQ